MVGVFERVYEVGPVFRAEPHDTARHLAQYTSLDAELGFIGGQREVMAVLREAVAGMVAGVGQRASAAAGLLDVSLPEVPDPIPDIHFADAQELIAAAGRRDPRGEPDLSPADERWLGEWAQREFGSEFLFVTGYPMAKRPFYTAPRPRAPRLLQQLRPAVPRAGAGHGRAAAAPVRRLPGGAGRSAARTRPPYASYLQVFAHGMPPHGGFAIGLERWVARLTGAANVRQVTLFPRDLHRLSP